jgi:hypothetical protein
VKQNCEDGEVSGQQPAVDRRSEEHGGEEAGREQPERDVQAGRQRVDETEGADALGSRPQECAQPERQGDRG